MNISAYIQQKKQQFFVARDADKLQLQTEALTKQRDELRAERERTQAVRDLQSQIAQEQTQLHTLRTQGSTDLYNRLRANIARFSNTDDHPDKIDTTPISPYKTDGVRTVHNHSPLLDGGKP